jgi:hypothetical protein
MNHQSYRCVKFDAEIDRSHIYKLCVKLPLQVNNTNMATVRNFGIMSDKFKVDIICIYVSSPQNKVQ